MAIRQLDDMHVTTSTVDGTQKPFRAIVGPREIGKTTTWTLRAWKWFSQEKRPFVIFRNYSVDFTDMYLNSIWESISEFRDDFDPTAIKFRRGDKRDGNFPIYYKGDIFCYGCNWNAPVNRIKSTIINNMSFAVYDEAILNIKEGEKYPPGLVTKWDETYRTWVRCLGNEKLTFYLFGNPYSFYHPLFSKWGLTVKTLHDEGLIIKGNCALQYAKLDPRLKKLILERNPNYEFDDNYSRYVLGGEAINDDRLVINPTIPQYFSLRYFFKLNGDVYAVFGNDAGFFDVIQFHIALWKQPVSPGRPMFSFSFDDLALNTVLYQRSFDQPILAPLKRHIATRRVSYSNLDAAYLMEEIYPML